MAHKDNQDKHSKADADKDFGLPKVEITPLSPREAKLESQPESTPVASAPVVKEAESKPEKTPIKKQDFEPKPVSKSSDTVVPPIIKKEGKSNKGVWISIILILLLVFIGVGWFWYGQERDVTEPEQITTISEPEVIDEPEVIEEESETVDEEPETFTLTPIKSRATSPRYFVVVGSFIDEDMALDYSARLIRQNKNTYLVYPYGEIAYYRLAIGEYATLDQAVEVLEENQANYKENLWVLKY